MSGCLGLGGEKELVQLCSSEYDTEQHTLLRQASNGSPLHARKSPRRGVNFNCRQRPRLIVARQLGLHLEDAEADVGGKSGWIGDRVCD
jgi:hypothetical protein